MADFLPQAADDTLESGLALERAGDLAGALEAYREAAGESPRAAVDMGRVLLRQGQLQEAAEAFAQAIAGDPELPGAHLGAGVAAWEQGEQEAACEAFRAAAGAKSGYVPAQYYLGLCLLALDKPKEALEFAEIAARNAPSNGKVLWAFGRVLFACNLFPPARDALRKARSLMLVEEPALRHLLGRCYLAMEAPELARAQWESLVEDEEHGPSLEALATLLADEDPEAAAGYRRRAEALQSGVEVEAPAPTPAPTPPPAAAKEELAPETVATMRAEGQAKEALELVRKALLDSPARAELHFERALCYRETGAEREAVTSLRKALQLRKRFPEASWELGQMLRARGETLTAKRALEDAAEGGIILAHAALGALFEEADNPARALEQYTLVREAGAADAALLGRIGELMFKRGDVDGAREALDEASSGEPLPGVVVTRAEIALKDGDEARAMELYEQFLTLDGSTSDQRVRGLRIKNQIARNEENRARAAEARRREQEAAEEEQRKAEAMAKLRAEQAALREQREAEEAAALERAQSTQQEAAARRAAAVEAMKAAAAEDAEEDRAEEVLEARAVASAPAGAAPKKEAATALQRELQKDGRAQQMLARALKEAKEEKKRPATARSARPGTSRTAPPAPREPTAEERSARIAEYRALLEARPDSWLIRTRLGSELLKAKEVEAARSLFDQLLEREPDEARAWFGRGTLRLLAGELAEAIAPLERAVRLNHDLVKAWNNLAYAYGALDKHRDSERSARSGRLAERRLDNAINTHLHKGHKLGREGRHEAAEKEFQAALLLDPHRGVLWNKVGTARFEQHDYESAVLYFAEAAYLDPDSAQVHKNLASAQKSAGQLRAALQSFGRAAALDAEDSAARNELGFLALHFGMVEEAKEAFEQSLAILPQNPMIHLSLGQVHERLEDYEKAEKSYRAAIALRKGQAENHLALGNLYLRQRRLDEAREALLRALERGGQEASSLYSLACLHALGGDADTAITTLEKAIAAGFAHAEALDRDEDLASLREDPRFAALRGKLGA